MTYLTTKDGTEIYFNNGGTGTLCSKLCGSRRRVAKLAFLGACNRDSWSDLGDVYLPCHDPAHGEAVGIKFAPQNFSNIL